MRYKVKKIIHTENPSFGDTVIYRKVVEWANNFAFPAWSGEFEDDALVMNVSIQRLTKVAFPCRRMSERNGALVELNPLFEAGIRLSDRFVKWFTACPHHQRFKFGQLDSLGRLKNNTTKMDMHWLETNVLLQSKYKIAAGFCDFFGGLRLVFKTSNGSKVAVWTN